MGAGGVPARESRTSLGGGSTKALQKWPGQSWRTSCCHFCNVPRRLAHAGCYPDTVPALLGVQGSGQRGEEAKTLPPVTGTMEETNRGLDGESWGPYMEEEVVPGPAACMKGARKNIPSIKGDLGKFQKLSGGPRGCCTGHHWMKSAAWAKHCRPRREVGLSSTI